MLGRSLTCTASKVPRCGSKSWSKSDRDLNATEEFVQLVGLGPSFF